MANMSLKKNPMPSQEPDVRNKNFDEVALGYTEEMAIDEAKRCLNCKNPKCVNGCPVNVHIPEFIAKVAEGKFDEAFGVKTTVSMSPIMIDGTGMCGGCRLSVGGEMKFACVDGPDFDGHKVDWDLAVKRNQMYRDFEAHKYEETCNLFKKEAE